jgi:hypothetical protein
MNRLLGNLTYRTSYMDVSLISPGCQQGVLLHYTSLRLSVSRLRITQRSCWTRRTNERNSKRPDDFLYAALHDNVTFYVIQSDLCPATVRQGATCFAHNTKGICSITDPPGTRKGVQYFYPNIEEGFGVIWNPRICELRARIILRSGILLHVVNYKFTNFWRNLLPTFKGRRWRK